MGADAARDFGVSGRRRKESLVGLRRRSFRKPQEFRLNPVGDRERAELDNPGGQTSYLFRQMSHDRHHEGGMIAQGLEERFLRHDHCRARLDSFDARRAWLAIDRRQFTEDRAFVDVAEAHPLAAWRIDVDARFSAHEEQHIRGPVFMSDDELLRSE